MSVAWTPACLAQPGSPCRGVATRVMAAAAPSGRPTAGPPPAGHIIHPIVRASARPRPIWRRDNGAFFRPALGGDELGSLPKEKASL